MNDLDVPDEQLAHKDTLAAALSAVLPFLPAVLGVDVGLRQDGAELTDDLVPRVLVADADVVPEGLAAQVAGIGFPVAVVERELTPLLDDGPHDPLLGGITVSAAHGALLVSRGGPGRWAASPPTRSSVASLACPAPTCFRERRGRAARRPGLRAGAATDRQAPALGRVHRLAVFALDEGFITDQSIVDIGATAGMARASVGDLVRKRGRTTELTLGRVSAVGLAPLGVGTPANSLEAYARDLNAPILSKPGDSGSLVVNDRDEVVGILTQKGIEYSRLVTIGVPPDPVRPVPRPACSCCSCVGSAEPSIWTAAVCLSAHKDAGVTLRWAGSIQTI